MVRNMLAVLVVWVSASPARALSVALQPTGHGALDGAVVVLDPGHGAADPGCKFVLENGPSKLEFWEAAYTYAAAYELAAMLQANGATVYLTCTSETARTFVAANAQTPRPLPRDAKASDNGKPIENGDQGGLRHRAKISNDIYKVLGKPNRCYFLALHIDSMGFLSGWSGSHVCYNRGHSIPRLAYAIEARIRDYKVARAHNGQPAPVAEPRSLGVLRTNAVPEAVLIEMAIPDNLNDSWRVRKDGNRQLYLKSVVLGALLDLQDPIKLQSALARHGKTGSASSGATAATPQELYTDAESQFERVPDVGNVSRPSLWEIAYTWFRWVWLMIAAFGIFMWHRSLPQNKQSLVWMIIPELILIIGWIWAFGWLWWGGAIAAWIWNWRNISPSDRDVLQGFMIALTCAVGWWIDVWVDREVFTHLICHTKIRRREPFWPS